LQDAVEALEVKVGVDGSSDTSSLDYRVRGWRRQSLTANYSATAADGGKVFDNAGAAGAVQVTLPDSPPAGTRYRFQNVGGQNLSVAVGGSRRFRSGGWLTNTGAVLTAASAGAWLEVVFSPDLNAYLITDSAGLWAAGSAVAYGLNEVRAAALETKNGSSTSEQEFANLKATLATDAVNVGTVIQIEAALRLVVGSFETPTLTFRMRYGGTGGTALATATTGAFAGDSVIFVRAAVRFTAVGGSGSAETLLGAHHGSGLTQGYSVSTVSTTTDKTLGLTVQYAASVPNTNLKMLSGVMQWA
jgi:hypothetical protein